METTYRKFVVALAGMGYMLVDRILAYVSGTTPCLTGWYAVVALSSIIGLYSGANVTERILKPDCPKP